MDQSKMDKIISRIKKLLQLGGDRNDNEAEAAQATAKAQALMAEYNLEMATVEASGRVADVGAGGKREKVKTKGRAMYAWQRDLMKYVARANYCYHIVTQEWYQTKVSYLSLEKYRALDYSGQDKWDWNSDNAGGESPWELGFTLAEADLDDLNKAYKRGGVWRHRPQHILVGREANVITAQHMFDYLCKTVERLVPIENNSQRLSRSAMSWKEGCSDRVCNRLWERRCELERQQETKAEEAQNLAIASGSAGSAMVLLGTYAKTEQDANWEHAHGYSPGTLQKWKHERIEQRREAEAEAALAAEAEVAALAAMNPAKREKYLAKQAREAAREGQRAEAAERRRESARRTAAHNAWEKRDHSAYNAGHAKGASIGLDPQMGGSSSHRIK